MKAVLAKVQAELQAAKEEEERARSELAAARQEDTFAKQVQTFPKQVTIPALLGETGPSTANLRLSANQPAASQPGPCLTPDALCHLCFLRGTYRLCN